MSDPLTDSGTEQARIGSVRARVNEVFIEKLAANSILDTNQLDSLSALLNRSNPPSAAEFIKVFKSCSGEDGL